MRIDILTIFPEFFDIFIETSMIKKAIMQSLVDIKIINLRDYSQLKHQKVDDTPYGGGAGMLLAFPPLYEAIQDLKTDETTVILLSPQGNVFEQKTAIELSEKKHVILICGHYEGIDARILEYIDLELSIGNYVLTGGEIPAMIVTDAITRLIPGVLHEASSQTDSLQHGLLKYPQYTKPEHYKDHSVPEILLSGHHGNIEAWRTFESLKQTYLKRPDLIEGLKLTEAQQRLLKKIIDENV